MLCGVIHLINNLLAFAKIGSRRQVKCNLKVLFHDESLVVKPFHEKQLDNDRF